LKKKEKEKKGANCCARSNPKSFSEAKNLYGNFAKLALVCPAMQFVSKIDLI